MSNTFSQLAKLNPLRRNRSPGEAEFNALVQLFPQAALMVDASHDQIRLVNSAFLQLTAYSSSDVLGRAPRDLIPDLPTSPQSTEEPFTVQLNRYGRPPLTILVQIKVLDAEGQWRLITCQQQENPRNRLLSHLDGVTQGIIDLNRLAQTAQAQPAAQAAVDIICRALQVNVVAVYQFTDGGEQALRLATSGNIGLLPDQFSAADWVRLMRTQFWRPGKRVQNELHRCARMNNLGYVVSTPFGKNFLLAVGDLDQDPPEILGGLMQVLAEELSTILLYSRLYHHSQDLAEDYQRDLLIWRQVAENAQEGILLLAPDLSVSKMNNAAEWMLGYAEREVRGQPVENVLIGPERLAPVLESARHGIPTHNLGHVSVHRRNGQSFPVHIQIIPVLQDEALLGVMVFFSDVSEHEEIRQRTQQLEQRAVLGEVTAVFAHEVRNPINNISTGLQLLSVKLPEDDPNQENITRLVNDCQRLNHLMESVLNFSRHVEHKFEEVNLEVLLNRLLDRWRPRMAKVNVTPRFLKVDNTPSVRADPRSMEQVFTNLISNAVEAMSAKGGTLVVRIEPYNQVAGQPQVEITVTDNGPGIPDEIRERIFEPFVTTKQQGTGLGLAITKRIVTAHHGSIRVNAFPGGTVFHVLLPTYQGEGV